MEIINNDKSYLEIPSEKFEFTQVDNDNILDVVEGKTLSFWKDAWKRLIANKAALVSLIVIGLIILGSIIIPMISNYGINDQDPYRNYLAPRIKFLEKFGIFNGYQNGKYEYSEHPDLYFAWGTDGLGRDVFTRVWYGTRISLFIAFLAAVIDMLIGVTYGGISGFFGGKVDLYMQRVIEIIAGIPTLVIATLFILVFEPGLVPITLALVLTSWIGMSRVVRAQFIKYREQEFILAARTLGASNIRLMVKHLFPNIIGQVVVVSMFSIPGAIFYEAFLSYIGLGIQPPETSLGVLISDAQPQLGLNPHTLFFPAAILSILMLTFNLLANGLRDALDPRLRSK